MNEHVSLESTRILVPVNCSEETDLNSIPVDLLSSVEIVLLGYCEVPEQSVPEQVRDALEDDSRQELERVLETFEDRGCRVVSSRLVFTPDYLESINTVADEEHCDAVLTPGETDHIGRILVLVRGDVNLDRITFFVSGLLGDETRRIELLSVAEPGEGESRRTVLEKARRRLMDRGVRGDVVHVHVKESDDPVQTVLDEVSGYDLVILGESEPSLRDLVFGSIHQQIVDAASVPVITVRLEREPPVT